MVLSLPYFYHNVLEELTKSNKYNLLHQKSKSVVELTVRHWPRMVVGGTGVSFIIRGFIPYKEFAKVLYNIVASTESVEQSLWYIIYLTPVVGFIGLIYVEKVSATILSLRRDDKQRQLRQAEKIYRIWKWISSTLWTIGTVPYVLVCFLRMSPSLISLTSNPKIQTYAYVLMADPTFAGMTVWKYIAEFGVQYFWDIFYAWGLKTLIRDLKEEPRHWWGGSIKEKAVLKKKKRGGRNGSKEKRQNKIKNII